MASTKKATAAQPRAELPIIGFARPAEWLAWLADNHASAPGLWVKLGKKSAGASSITYDEAVEGALCYGWIDGQKKPYDDAAWLQKFTPRGPKSIWSQINRGKAEALITGGQMQPAGLRAVEAAKADGLGGGLRQPEAWACRRTCRPNWTATRGQGLLRHVEQHNHMPSCSGWRRPSGDARQAPAAFVQMLLRHETLSLKATVTQHEQA
jgi:hypothetical protein